MLNKLKNKQGVTILMALLFLLLAIVISCIVITAAITAVKTVDGDRAQQQAYLNVSSAVELLKKEIVGTEIKTVTRETFDSYDTSKEWEADDPTVVKAADSVKGILEEIAPYMNPQNATTPSAGMREENAVEFFIESTVGSVTSQVKVTMVVSYVEEEGTFQLIAKLSNMDEKYSCEMLLTMRANSSVSTGQTADGNNQKVVITTTTYTWTTANVVVSKGEGESA